MKTYLLVTYLVLFALGARADECQDKLEQMRGLMNDSFANIASDHDGFALLGIECDPELVSSWFSSVGWELRHERAVPPQQSGAGSYWVDMVFVFGLPRQWPWKWLTDGYSAQANVSMFEGRITHISAGAYGVSL